MNIVDTISEMRQQQHSFLSMKKFIQGSFPDTMRALRAIDLNYTQPKRKKGYSLFKRENKKFGFVYYVRYYHQGKMLPTKWNTGTTVEREAEQFANENRERLIAKYLSSRDKKMYEILANFYEEKIPYLSVKSIRLYRSAIKNNFIPFLRDEKIHSFEKISPAVLHRFQDMLLSCGVTPQTVNNKMKAVRKLFATLLRQGAISENPALLVKNITVRMGDYKPRGCHELESIKGVFNKVWDNDISYILALLIYTTGMRNGEILRIKLDDIQTIDGCRFITVNESKTASGIRLVPLHDFVFKKLEKIADGKDTSVFEPECSAAAFNKANLELARQLGVSEAELKRERISFYSGRHFWKTLMSSEGLGEDIEEIFMGHKVSGNVAKLYNHRDRHGKAKMAEKARQMFSILDRCVFGTV